MVRLVGDGMGVGRGMFGMGMGLGCVESDCGRPNFSGMAGLVCLWSLHLFGIWVTSNAAGAVPGGHGVPIDGVIQWLPLVSIED